MRSDTASTYWFFFLFTIITAIVFWPIYGGNFTLGGDAKDVLLPVLSHIRAAILQGDWPYWNPFQFQGLDTTLFPVYWNPFFLLCSVLFPNPATALSAIYLTLLYIAGWGYFKFSGLYVQEPTTAILGGLCYPLIGLFVVNGTDIGVVAAAAFLPLLLHVNHQFQRSGKLSSLFLLALGYFSMSTMTSFGFLILIGLGLLIQGWMTSVDSRLRINRLVQLLAAITTGGLLVWKIIWERSHAYLTAPALETQEPGFYQSIHDLVSFVLPQVKAMPVEFGGLEGPALFHHYVGILLLVFAGSAMIIRTSSMDRKIGILSLLLFFIGVIGSMFESTGPTFSGMTGSAFSTLVNITFTILVLLMGLRGYEKIITQPTRIRYVFLGLSIIAAGLAISVKNTSAGGAHSGGLTAWFLELDGWKTAFFCILTAIALWIRGSTIRWGLVATLILVDLGLTNYLIQDENFWHSHPNSTFVSSVIYPENNHPEPDLNASVGRYQDRDFSIGGIDRNTGTLTRRIVRDGYWPWIPDTSCFSGAGFHARQLRYPIFYFSRDTSGWAAPNIAEYDPEIQILNFTDHRWELSLHHQYEKYLVLNQNYHPGWIAQINGERIPVVPTHTGMMKIPLTPGKHIVHFEFKPDGVHHVFGFSLILVMLAILYLIRKKSFPTSALGCGIPLVLLLLIRVLTANTTNTPSYPPPAELADYTMNYESLPQNWFLRGQQVDIVHSRSGYRSEHLNETASYSATLQLDSTVLQSQDELRYRFFIRSDESVKLGVVLETFNGNTPSHNIDRIHSLDTDDWTEVEGWFSLQDLPRPLIGAKWYIWNYEQGDFLIDDIEIKLNP